MTNRWTDETIRLNAKIDLLKAGNATLRDMVDKEHRSWQAARNELTEKDKEITRLKEELSALISLIEDDEAAEKVANPPDNAFTPGYLFGRHEAINDYRKMLREVCK